MKWYVYELQVIKGKTFYVGKGCGERVLEHRKLCKSKTHPNKKLQSFVRRLWENDQDFKEVKVFFTVNEDLAYQEESRRVQEYGLKNLCNLIPGGRRRTP